MRASYTGEEPPSRLSPVNRVKHAEFPLTDLANDAANVTLLLIPIQDRDIVIGRIVLGCHETFNSGTAANIKIGTRITSTQDTDAIADFDIAVDMAIGTSVIKEAKDLKATLKTSKGVYPNHPVVPAGYAVEATCTKAGVSGNNGQVKGFIEWWYADDVNPA